MIARVFLWLFVIALGIEIGAGLYETLVVLPTWTGSPPGSVTTYYQQVVSSPQLALNAGPRFWMIATPLVGVVALATLLSGFRTRPPHRNWRIAGTVLALIVVVSTFAWFVPNIMRLNGPEVMKMIPEDITSLTHSWVNLNTIRIVFYVTGWICALRAFGLPDEPGQT